MQFDLEGIGMTSRRTRDRLARRLADRGIRDIRILDLVRTVPRHIFVDEALEHRAYEDTPLPIGHNQTISQPYVVARMTEAMFAAPRRRVLEVGTGSGYQTAFIAGLSERTFSVERIAPLLERARARLRAIGLNQVRTRLGDGALGWPSEAPFDAIMVTAAARVVPEELLGQLAVGGRLVIPVGDEVQQLRTIDKTEGGIRESVIDAVRFVPMLSGTER